MNAILKGYNLGTLRNISAENQNNDYEAFICDVNETSIRSRRAKLTPKKAGYFVAFWEKSNVGKNQAYTYDDFPDKLIINIMDEALKGQFIFPKDILNNYGILQTNSCQGKMAMRVYPTWCKELNKTALATQKWQANYFIDMSKSIDEDKFKQLYLN